MFAISKLSKFDIWSRGWPWLLSLVLSGALMMPASARNANYRLCFPSVTWFGGGSPVVDGNISGDAGWRGGVRYIFDNMTNGTPLSNVIVQGIKDAGNLYLSFAVH